jgi:hypothetical protein
MSNIGKWSCGIKQAKETLGRLVKPPGCTPPDKFDDEYFDALDEARRLALVEAAGVCRKNADSMRKQHSLYECVTGYTEWAAGLLDRTAEEIEAIIPVGKNGTNTSPITFPSVGGSHVAFVALLDKNGKEVSRQPITPVTR